MGFRYTWSEISETPPIYCSRHLLYTLERLSILRNYSAPITTKSYVALKAAEMLDEKHNSTSKFIITYPVDIS